MRIKSGTVLETWGACVESDVLRTLDPPGGGGGINNNNDTTVVLLVHCLLEAVLQSSKSREMVREDFLVSLRNGGAQPPAMGELRELEKIIDFPLDVGDES